MIQSMNFPLSTYSLRPYGSWETLSKTVQELGLDGLEVIADPDNLADDIPLTTQFLYPASAGFQIGNTGRCSGVDGRVFLVRRYIGRKHYIKCLCTEPIVPLVSLCAALQ